MKPSIKYYSLRELDADTNNICQNLNTQGEAVIINNDKPIALILDISQDDLDETLSAIRQARAMVAFQSLKANAPEQGYFTEAEIADEILAYRQEKQEHLTR